MAALIAAAELPTPRFAPPVDRPFRYTIVETRTDDGIARRFTIERSIVFRGGGSSYTADIALLRVDAPADDIGARFVAGTRALAGRTLRFHLSGDGAIVSIDDLDAIWAAMTSGVKPLAGPRANPASAMAAMSAERKLAVLASMLSPVLAVRTEPSAAPSARPVHLASRALAGRMVMLDGSETVVAHADGGIHHETSAAGGEGDAKITVTRSSDSDPATGLIRSSHETQRITQGTGISIKETSIELSPLVS